MSLQCIARALSQQIKGCSSCSGFKQLKLFSPLTRSVKPTEQTSLVTRVQHFKTSSPQSFKTTQVRFSPGGHNHSKLWTVERAVSAGLVVLLPAALATPNSFFDVLLAVSMVLHTHWGFEAIVVDYVRPSIFGPLIPKISIGLMYALSILTLAGLLQITFNDKGLGRTIRSIWART